MVDIKKLAAGVIAGAAITAAPLMAFAAPASAATATADPTAASSNAQDMLVNSQQQPGANQQVLGGGSSFAHASHCGGGMHCDECGCWSQVTKPSGARSNSPRPGAWPSGSVRTDTAAHIGLDLRGEGVRLEQARQQTRLRHLGAEYQVDRHIVTGAKVDRNRVSGAHRAR
jgi:hypothetical protein